tara:strand:- start:79 stop:789 length:711 start_codon:yes stop_codon:yes gene_type:complete
MKILIFAAHPDDEVLGMGGTMKKLSKSGNDLKIIFMSTGILSRRNIESQRFSQVFTDEWMEKNEKKIKSLRHDAKKSGKILGVDKIEFMDFPDNEMDVISTLVVAKNIENSIKEFKPNIVYTTPQDDVNVDHKKVFEATLVATRPKKNSLPEQVISYEIPSSSEWFFPKQFSPNIFENIEKEFPSKIRAIKCYKNELMEYPHPRSTEALEMIAKRWGTVAGFNFAEAFSLVRNLKK